jgi:hypothetical protein
MKKYLAAFAALLVPLLFTVMVHAQPPKVGEPMLDVVALAYQQNLMSIERSFGIYTLEVYFDPVSEEPRMYAAYHICNEIRSDTPFGVLIIKRGGDQALLFLDNAPTDGVIDEVIHNPMGREIAQDLPTCV